MAVWFMTPGSIEEASFTTFGLNEKPNTTSPLGFFGTGLKIAIAVIYRLGGSVQIENDLYVYTFKVKEKTFRDAKKEFIQLRRYSKKSRSNSYKYLPYTIELGKHWEVWMAFRELESNTRDEGGTTVVAEYLEEGIFDTTTHTAISVTLDSFEAIANNSGTVFLDISYPWFTDQDIQVFARSSDYLYYRGVRIYKLPKPSICTYNFLGHIDITEDRTAKYPFWLKSLICNLVIKSQSSTFIAMITRASEDYFEHSLEFDTITDFSNEVFNKEVVPIVSSSFSPRLQSYSVHYIQHVESQKIEPLPDRLAWWITSGELSGYPDVVVLIKEAIVALGGDLNKLLEVPDVPKDQDSIYQEVDVPF